MSRFAFVAALACLGALSACDGDGVGRYPAPLDLPSASVVELRTTAPVPGRYNVEATVVKITRCYCPPDVFCAPCLFADGVVVSETGAPFPESDADSLDAAGYLHVAAEDPEQFERGGRYLLSVSVESRSEGVDGSAPPIVWTDLLGYGRAE
ncbi:hypothetical protein RQM47_01355 [Rubrivirga sp. S365]|uniref:Lipoprotein n=1 Tax=Rubrivirga litoralis TaxID=3075598 RepID=A0ABU3BRV8_9BACT|nr:MULTISPECIES: hypothetical protein [unclassified Rubrivirga]MDT0632025.1 hypothetical protein [Rubrivirga sp. F394]MDT7855282.1 hypothetical protein [Rubrivirga sp. S365]